MNRQLTQEQTEELFSVCRNNAVEHYDVQMEMVDHLASSIEDIWKTNPEMDFRTAQKQVVQQFGTKNFTQIYAEKERQLIKKYTRMFFKYILEFYRWPKVVITFVFTIGLFLLFQIIEQTKYVFLSYIFLLPIAIILYFVFVYPKIRVKTDSWKSFLMLDYMNQVRNTSMVLFQIPLTGWVYFSDLKNIQNTWILLGGSFLLVFLNVMLYAHFFYIPKRIREHFIATYPQFVK